ncbi:MAG: hypothetical protein ABIG40_00155 [Parcubacteria group bacterium]
MAVLTLLVLGGAILYAIMSAAAGERNFGGLIPILVPVLVVIFMAFFIQKRYRDIKEGMPMEDERSRKVVTRAAAKSFYFSLYWLLTISWFEPFFARVLFGGEKLDASQTVGGGIAGMAIFFFIFWFYYDKKGKLI